MNQIFRRKMFSHLAALLGELWSFLVSDKSKLIILILLGSEDVTFIFIEVNGSEG